MLDEVDMIIATTIDGTRSQISHKRRRVTPVSLARDKVQADAAGTT